MRKIKKSLIIFMASVFVMAGNLGNITVKASLGKTIIPTISRVGLGHPLVAGENRTFTVTSATTYLGNVQYRAFIAYGNHNNWTEITNGYTVGTSTRTTVVLPAIHIPSHLGNYRLSVWVKVEGTKGNVSTSLGDYESQKSMMI